jgi:hypothetical protein
MIPFLVRIYSHQVAHKVLAILVDGFEDWNLSKPSG